MINRKNQKKIIKLLILIFTLMFLLKLITFTISRYESLGEGNTNIEVAFFVIKKDFQEMTLNLEEIIPRDEPYVYNFTISNKEGDNMCETDMEYDLILRTTTNMPLEYELYMNQSYQDADATSIIKKNEIIKDADGTYFSKITTQTENFSYKEEKTNTYELVVYFPSIYNTTNYQDLIDMIEISINARQVI